MPTPNSKTRRTMKTSWAPKCRNCRACVHDEAKGASFCDLTGAQVVLPLPVPEYDPPYHISAKRRTATGFTSNTLRAGNPDTFSDAAPICPANMVQVVGMGRNRDLVRPVIETIVGRGKMSLYREVAGTDAYRIAREVV